MATRQNIINQISSSISFLLRFYIFHTHKKNYIHTFKHTEKHRNTQTQTQTHRQTHTHAITYIPMETIIDESSKKGHFCQYQTSLVRNLDLATLLSDALGRICEPRLQTTHLSNTHIVAISKVLFYFFCNAFLTQTLNHDQN